MPQEIWVADFEFNGTDGGNIPHPVCFCATELHTNKTIKVFLDEVTNPPAPINFENPDLIYIAHYSVAEMRCHLALGWHIPEKIFDTYSEFRVLTNDGQGWHKSGLLDACQHFSIPTIDQAKKDKMRDRVLAGSPYSDTDKQEILDYCDSDIIETMALFKAMQPKIENWEGALFRGRYMAITAQIENAGVPLDVETLTLMRRNWDLIKLEFIKEINKKFNFFEGLTFKMKAFAEYLYKNNISWQLTDKDNLSMKDETWKEAVLIYPHLQPVRDARALLGKFKKFNVACGSDGRNRGMLSPFSTKTGRNAPNIQNIFTNPSWMRCLIKPPEGKALAYIDYEQQEFFIAAMLSGDKNMQAMYNSGDTYLQFAKMAGAVPPEGTTKTHKATRDLYKQCCISIQYGAGAKRLSISVNKPLAYAKELIRQHQRLFPQFWKWQEQAKKQAKLNKRVRTVFGWQMHVLQGTFKMDLTVGNFLMQATGADILRTACYKLSEAGIKIVAPVHDALMIEVNLDIADADVKRAEALMQEASNIVLGEPLRTETVIVKYPDRYMDEKGKATWDRVMRILDEIQSGKIKTDNPDASS